MINKYRFGHIIVDGRAYYNDVYINLKKKVKKWWRKESHIFDIEDIKEAVEEGPEIIVLGTGDYGVAKITNEAENFINNKKIKVIISKTGKAIKQYNKLLSQNKKVVALLHLTC